VYHAWFSRDYRQKTSRTLRVPMGNAGAGADWPTAGALSAGRERTHVAASTLPRTQRRAARSRAGGGLDEELQPVGDDNAVAGRTSVKEKRLSPSP
jgi:hypothetical protein